MAGPFDHLTGAAATDKGRKRANNEDAYGLFPGQACFCVADGVGGEAEGEVASHAVVDRVGHALEPLGTRPVAQTSKIAVIRRAVADAAQWIDRRAAERGSRRSATTFVAACLDPGAPGRACALHAGDSRLYRLRGDVLAQITRDHSPAGVTGRAEDELNPMFNGMVLRVIGGGRGDAALDETPFDVAPGDWLLLCSDGLSRMTPDAEIVQILRATPGAQEAANALIDAANAHGGVDNITTVVVNVGALPPPCATETLALPKQPRRKAGDTASATGADGGPDAPRPSNEPRMPRRFLRRGGIVAVVAAALAIAVMLVGRPPPKRAVPVDFRVAGAVPDGLAVEFQYRPVGEATDPWFVATNGRAWLLPGSYDTRLLVPDYELPPDAVVVRATARNAMSFDASKLKPGPALARLMEAMKAADNNDWAAAKRGLVDMGGLLLAETHLQAFKRLAEQCEARLQPSPAGGTLRFAAFETTTNPPATAYVDGTFVGTLPRDALALARTGEIAVVLARADFASITQTVWIASGATGTVDAARIQWSPGAPLVALLAAESAMWQADWKAAVRWSEKAAAVPGLTWTAHREHLQAIDEYVAAARVQSAPVPTVVPPPAAVMPPLPSPVADVTPLVQPVAVTSLSAPPAVAAAKAGAGNLFAEDAARAARVAAVSSTATNLAALAQDDETRRALIANLCELGTVGQQRAAELAKTAEALGVKQTVAETSGAALTFSRALAEAERMLRFRYQGDDWNGTDAVRRAMKDRLSELADRGAELKQTLDGPDALANARGRDAAREAVNVAREMAACLRRLQPPAPAAAGVRPDGR